MPTKDRRIGASSGANQLGVVGVFLILVLLAVASALILFRYAENQKNLLDKATAAGTTAQPAIEKALLSFVQTNKRLPCPALPNSASGLEDAATPFATCATPDGVLPWGSIGLSLDQSLDPWGRKYSYRVFSGLTGLTRVNGMNAVDCNTSSLLTATQVPLDANGMCASSPRGTRSPDFLVGKGLTVNDKGSVITGVAYVLISHGPTGRGAYDAYQEPPPAAAVRNTLPDAASKERINTTAPADNTYWILPASSVGADSNSAAYFDDIVSYKSISDLLSSSGMSPRDWGWVTLSKAFSPSTFSINATPPTTSTLTITLTNSSQTQATLNRTLTDTFPTGMVAASTPSATTDCTVGKVPTSLTVSAGDASISLPNGYLVPAATVTAGVKTNGSCTVTVNVSSTVTNVTSKVFTNTLSAGSATCTVIPLTAVGYLCTDQGWNINAASANVTAALNAPTLSSISPTSALGSTTARTITLSGTKFLTGATVTFTNLSTSATSTVSATFVSSTQLTASYTFGTTGATWSVQVNNPDGQTTGTQNIVITAPTSATTTAASLTAAGFTLGGGTQGCVSSAGAITLGSLIVTPFASGYSPAYVSASADGFGVASAGCTTGSSLSSGSGESITFMDSVSGYRYLGLKAASFSSNGGGTNDDELAVVTFYDSTGAAISPSQTIRACNASTSASATSNFYLDAGQSFRGFRVTPITRADSGTSTLRVASFLFCESGPAGSCSPPAASGTNCP